MFEVFLMQADFVSAATGLVVALATLLSAASGIIVYVINRKQSVGREQLSERDKRILEVAKATLLGGQKTVENIGAIRELMEALRDAVGPEQRGYLDERIGPMLAMRLQVGNEQIAHVRGTLVNLIGDKANVDSDPNIVREPKEMSERLRQVTTWTQEIDKSAANTD